MLEQPLDSRGYLPFTVQCLCDLREAIPAIDCQALPTQSLPREAKDFPRGGNYPKDVPLPICLDNSGLIILDQ